MQRYWKVVLHLSAWCHLISYIILAAKLIFAWECIIWDKPEGLSGLFRFKSFSTLLNIPFRSSCKCDGMAFKQLREDSRVVSVMSVSMYTSFYHIKKEETQHHIHNLVFNVCICGSGFVYTLQMKCPHKDIKKTYITLQRPGQRFPWGKHLNKL